MAVSRSGVLAKNRGYQKGIMLLDQGQYSLAAVEFEKVLAELDEHDPCTKLARFHLGEARAQLGLEMLRRRAPERAEEELRRALEINPRYADLRYHLARALASEGNFEGALAELETALEINPAFAKAYFERGLLLFRAGREDQALAEIGRAVEIDPAYSRELYDSACLLCAAGKRQEALDRLGDLSCTNLDDIVYHFQLGKDCLNKGWYNRAITEFRKSLSLHSGYADVHNYLGTALLAGDKPEEARDEFEAALDINPQFLAATINAGDACVAMGDRESAIEYYQAALQLDPNNVDAAERLAGMH